MADLVTPNDRLPCRLRQSACAVLPRGRASLSDYGEKSPAGQPTADVPAANRL